MGKTIKEKTETTRRILRNMTKTRKLERAAKRGFDFRQKEVSKQCQ